MKTYYVVVRSWGAAYDDGIEVLAVKETAYEAQKILCEAVVQKEKKKVEERGWTVYTDEPYLFQAGQTGISNEAGYVKISIHEVEENIAGGTE